MGVTLIALSVSAHAEWSTSPATNLVVADRSGDQVQPKIVATSDGGFYISWFDNSAGGYDVYLQRLDAAGDEIWAHNGVLVADRSYSSTQDYGLSVDTVGNALLAFRDDRDGPDKVAVSKISPDGTLLWGADGIRSDPRRRFRCLAKGNRNQRRQRRRSLDLQQRCHGPETRSSRDRPCGARASPCPPHPTRSASAISMPPMRATQSCPSLPVRFSGQTIFGPRSWRPPTELCFGARGMCRSTTADRSRSPTTRPLSPTAPAVRSSPGTPPVSQRFSAVYSEYLPTDPRPSLTRVWWFPPTRPNNGSGRAPRFLPSTEEIVVFWTEENGGQSQWGLYGQKVDNAGVRQWTDSGLEFMPTRLGSGQERHHAAHGRRRHGDLDPQCLV